MCVKFNADIITSVPTACLVEDYQALLSAIKNEDWEVVQTVADCLAENISKHTSGLKGLDIVPSGSSLIAMGIKTGILLQDNKDFLCAAGKQVSRALQDGYCQCKSDCPHFKQDCFPETEGILLQHERFYEYGKSDEHLVSMLNSNTE